MEFRHVSIFLSIILLVLSNAIFAATPIEFFSSNNTGVIDMHKAYQRLTGDDQRRLQ